METIPVSLATDAYSIHISGEEPNWTQPLENFLKGKEPIIITSPKVGRFCLPRLKKVLRSYKTLLLPDGERFKNLSTVAKAYQSLIRLRADRTTPLLLLGGGVLGDLGGFVAATFLRGLSFVHIGTTLIAQVDSSIGGKLGFDLPEGKNLVGVFRQPKMVLSHIPFLKTLPPRELRGGLGEVVKYGVIKDPGLLELILKEKSKILDLKRRSGEDLLFEIVQRSTRIKARVVSEDEKESSLRMILNFGHTFGHALERLTKYTKYHHGEAIAVGMVIAANISHKLGYCSLQEAQELQVGLENLGLPTRIQAPRFSRAQWLRALEVDKKSRGGMIHFIFMKRIGEVTIQPIRPQELVKLL